MVVNVSVDPSKCTGCRYCELWCSFLHEKVFSTSLSRIRVVKDDLVGMDYPIVCKHCLNAPCVLACPTGALYKENGITKFGKDRCSKCGSCIEACPYGAAFQNPLDKTPLICDLCNGNPACVEKCPMNALSVYPLAEISFNELRRLGKRYLIAVREYENLLKRWGFGVRHE